MVNHSWRVALVLALFCAALEVDAADVVVRAVNGKNGKPLVRWPVYIYVIDDPSYREFNHRLAEAKTDQEGRAQFHFDDPPPESLFIVVGEAGRSVGCTDRPEFLTKEVVRSGIVAKNYCDKKGNIKIKFEAKPGEIVIFARRRTWRDDFSQEILRK